MGGKYEVAYYNYHTGEYVSIGYTNSIFEVIKRVLKLRKNWYCVTVSIRGNIKKEC